MTRQTGVFFDGKSSIKDLEDNGEQYHKLENEVKKCFSLFGENNENYSLAFQVESVLGEKKKLKKEIKKLAQENEQKITTYQRQNRNSSKRALIKRSNLK